MMGQMGSQFLISRRTFHKMKNEWIGKNEVLIKRRSEKVEGIYYYWCN